MAISQIEDRRQTSAPELPVAWIRPRQFSEVTGMSLRQVYDELYAGRLHSIQIGRSWFLRATEVQDFFARNGRPAA